MITAELQAICSSDLADRRRFQLIFSALLIVLLLSSLDSNILNTSLPHIAGEFGALPQLSWVVSSFMLTSILSTPVYGKLADRYSGKLMLCISITLFLAGSALCGLSRSLGELVLYRSLQGLGAGGLTALAQVMVAELVGPDRRSQYQGFFSATAAVSNIAGPLIGGALTFYLSWRWIFYINIPFGIAALAIILANLESRPTGLGRAVDYHGMLYLSLTTLPLLLWLSLGGIGFAWLSSVSAFLVGTSLLFGLFFFRREMSSHASFLGLHLLRDRTFLASSGAALGLGFATLGVNVYLPLWFQVVHGMNPIEAGLMLLPKILAMMLSAIVGIRFLLRRYSYKAVISIGLALEVVGVTGMAIASQTGASALVFQICLALMGSGMGIAWPNVITLLQNRVSRSDLGTATSTLTFLRALGGAVGVALAGALVSSWLGAASAPAGGHAIAPGNLPGEVAAAYRQVLGIVLALLALGMMVAFQSVWLLLPAKDPKAQN